MREVPDCLSRRYQALDDLIKELSSAIPGAGAGGPAIERPSNENNQVGIKLMCDFWNILKEDPDCNLTEEVQQRMGIASREDSSTFWPQRVSCYMAGREQDNLSNEDRKRDVMNRIRQIYCPTEPRISTMKSCCSIKSPPPGYDKSPLSKVLCNLKEAASFDKKCNVRVGELMAAQKELTEQIQNLEEREKEGVMLLKQADCMWSCMEESYKKKVAESLERQKTLLKELKEVETSSTKWRKNKKELEFQLVNIKKCHEDITEKINQKNNDMKVMDMEIEEMKKRIASNVKDIENANNSWRSKKEASDARLATIATEMVKLQNKLNQEKKNKSDKEMEGAQFVKEAREDLQKICRVLLQKKLENEDLRAEKDALQQEISLLKKTCDSCKEKCTNKEKTIEDEIKRLEVEVAAFKLRCVKCHECTDTVDVRKFCTDCPRCLAERDCLYEGDHCSPDHTMDCVCMSVKQKFLDNVFDNMYTVLERQAKTCPGKAVADCILNCLKRSRNGKLNEETRKILQEFILSTVKKNLNLTIVGGAVKTRCEMDQETYKQLMLCLKEIVVTRPTKEDKGTAKKEPCRRWGGPSECNCPKGPKACICTKKAPPPPPYPTSCGPIEPKDDTEKDVKVCPPRESEACGTDCGLLGFPDQVGADVAAMKRDPCGSKTCPFSKNMRAAQCVLGPEPLQVLAPKHYQHPTPPIIPNLLMNEKMATCTCGEKETKPCPCRDRRRQPRQRIIEEVMGRYTEVTPIEKVTSLAEREIGETNSSRISDAGCDCSNLPMKYMLASKMSENKISRFCACSSNYVSREDRAPFLKKLHKSGQVINICRSSKSDKDVSAIEKMTLVSQDDGYKITQDMNSLTKEFDNDIKVILCPKFPQAKDDKKEICLRRNKTQVLKCTQMRLKSKSSLHKNQNLNSCDPSFVGRKVCETVKELMKDIVVPQMPPNTLSSSEVEWITLESLFQEISSLTKLEGNTSEFVNEVEVKCETLEDSRDFKLLTKKISVEQPISFQNNIIGLEQNIITNQKEGTDDTNQDIDTSENIYNNEEQNRIAEELKLKLLDDIRQTYNISIETSLEKIVFQEPDYNVTKKENNRTCLCNFDEVSLDVDQCNCIQLRKYADHNSNIKQPKKYFRYEKCLDDAKHGNSSGFYDVKKCLLAITNMQKRENKAQFKSEDKNNSAFLKRNKIKKYDKIKKLKFVDTKLVKAEVKDNCNKSTCVDFWEQKEDNLQVASVQKDILFNGQKQDKLLQKYGRHTQNENREQLKVAIQNESGKSYQQYTTLKKTKSGRVAMELDESIIKLMDKKSKEHTLFASLRKTDSGHLMIDFNTKENAVNAIQRLVITRTPSGTRLLNMNKNTMSMLKKTFLKEIPNSDLLNSIKLSSTLKRKQNPQQVMSDKYSSSKVSKKSITQKKSNKCLKGTKESDNEFHASKKIQITSKILSSKQTNENRYTPQTFLKDGKIYERDQDSSMWTSVSSITDSKKPLPIEKVKCKCPPGENMERDECICPPSTKCTNSQKANFQETLECKCPIPPITYSWMPMDKITEKEKLDCTKTTPDSDIDTSLKIIKTECECFHDSKTTNSWESATSRSDLGMDVDFDFISELKELYKQGNADVVLKIRGKSGVVRKLPTIVTRTLSGTMAIYSRNMSSLGDISFDESEYPVFLSKTDSGTYFLGFGHYDRTLNATLRKTTSGGMLLVPKSKFIQQQIRKCPGFEKFFKVKVSGVREYPVELPAVLKTTPSDNYIIVLDKEFENSYRQTVNEYIGVKGECIIDLNRTNSGNYVIELDTRGESHLVKKNALLVKSSSGNVKVLVRGPEFEAMVQSVSKKSSTSSAKAFGKLVDKLPVSSREIHRENLRKAKKLHKKASSDTQLYEKTLKLEGNKRLLCEPPAVLKKTCSGQYAIVLNKASKKAFIKNLQSYIAGNSKGLVPIKRSESGEIIINLNTIEDSNAHYGALKITSSGNIFVMVDEEVIKVMAKGSKNKNLSSQAVDKKSTHGTETIDKSVNKAVATTCNAKPEDCNDPSSCVCGELQLDDATDWFSEEEKPSIFKEIIDEADHKLKDKYCGTVKDNTPRDKSPHIVIKPACDCRPPSKKNKFGSTEPCYYLIDTICPYHKGRYDAVSNEILEISGLCNKVQAQEMDYDGERSSEVPCTKKERKMWDSLNYLPPQLPPFLQNVSYRH